MDALRTPLLVAHCDWSTHDRKRWLAVGRVEASGGAIADAPEPVGNATTLLGRLRDRADGARVLVGFDFPIGVPRAYAERAGVSRFPELLQRLAAHELPAFFDPAPDPGAISVARPFYPARVGSSARQHLVDGLGVRDMTALLRRCERRTATRRAGSSLFWLVGGAQVGKAAIAGWRDVLLPSLAGSTRVGIWPHDGSLSELLETREVVLAETYPTEFATHLGARLGRAGKRHREGRSPACRALEATAAGVGIVLSDAAATQLADDFGDSSTGDDRFDAFLGLIGMLHVALGHREPGPPPVVPQDVVAIEGWILGQTDAG